MQPKASRSKLVILWSLAIGAIGPALIGCSGSIGPKPAATPAAILYFDTVSALPGTVATLTLRLAQGQTDDPGVDSLSGFNFLLAYDATALTFDEPPERSPNISEWEYFTYRAGSILPCDGCKLGTIRLLATRDLDDGKTPTPPQYSVTGTIASLQFEVEPNWRLIGDSIEIGFCLLNWSDNSISRDGGRNILFIPDTTLGRIEYVAGYDTNQSPRLYKLRPILELQSGWIHVAAPVDDRKGDVDLNGIRFEIHDAVIFANYFHLGYAAFDPQRASEQIAQTDLNGDGEPLTRADLAEMIRIIGGQVPIGDTSAVPYKDTLSITPWWDGHRYVISCQSTIQVDELWLNISGPAPLGTIHYLGEPTVVVSNSVANAQLHASCGTVEGNKIFGPEFGDRFEIQGYQGHWLDFKAQASRYPGVSMVVRVGPFIDTLAARPTIGGSHR